MRLDGETSFQDSEGSTTGSRDGTGPPGVRPHINARVAHSKRRSCEWRARARTGEHCHGTCF